MFTPSRNMRRYLFVSDKSGPRFRGILNVVLFRTIMLMLISINAKAANCDTQGKIETVPAIIDGKLVKDSQWPWIVSIMVQYQSQTFNCGGSLIHRYWVLTASHCLYSGDVGTLLPKEAFRILIGAVNIEGGREDGFETKVAYYVKNPGFIMKAVKKKNNDIALIKLAEPVPDKFYQIINIGDESTPQDGDRCMAMGWGCDHNSRTPVTTSQLYTVVLPVVPMDQCAQRFQELINGDVHSKICAGFFNKTIGICSGDSGGPLICRQDQQWVLSGIISFTIAMCPAVFTRVASYKDWVMDVIKKDEEYTRRLVMKESNNRLLAQYFQNRFVKRPTLINGYPYYEYILFKRMNPYVGLQGRG